MALTQEEKNAKRRAWYQKNIHRARQCDRAYKRRNPIKMAQRRLKFYYGLTIQGYDEIWIEQLGLCAICHQRLPNQPPSGTGGVVDHNHVTGAVRGLLCRKCNSGLGLLGDSAQNIKSALSYLRGCDAS